MSLVKANPVIATPAAPDARTAVTVVIATRNRKDDLCRAVESALAQSIAAEVLVVDDGSVDGTTELVRSRFPSARVERRDLSAGATVRRNEGARLARGEFIVSIDDDAIFSTPHVIEQTLADFKDDRRIGAVAIPCIDVLKTDKFRQPVPDREGVYVTSEFIGTAYAIRRDLFLQVGGYRDILDQYGEERDFCLRLMDAGYLVRLGNSDPIHHFESPKRDWGRVEFLGRRNDVLFAWQNVPARYLAIHLAGTTWKGMRFGMRRGRSMQTIRALAQGYIDALRFLGYRRPVGCRAYALSRTLRRQGCLTLAEAAARLERQGRATRSGR